VSIGGDLADARRLAGLTVTQVSQQTCIRETIIRGIERDDYAGCGGDFYVRGHIRAVARVVGADAGPLLREYDAARPPPQAEAAPIFRPDIQARLRERRRLNWSAVLGLALVIVLGFAAYHFVSARHATGGAGGATAGLHRALNHPRHGRPAPDPYAHEVVIQLAAIEDCWVEFTTPDGAELFQSYVVAGASKRWTFGHAVDMRLGNPSGVNLTVDGKNPVRHGTAQPITLTLGLHGKISS